VQKPVPDLAWLLWHLRLPGFWEQTEAWALKSKTTVWSLFHRSTIHFAPIWLRAHLDREKNTMLCTWLRPEFVWQQHIDRRRLQTVANKRAWLPGPPSPDSGYLSLAASIAGYLPAFSFAEQPALPYYDRDLVQFLFAIPGEQLLRPQQRRSLMRRAFRDTVPEVVLGRKTKWLGRREPALRILDNAAALAALLPMTPISERYVEIAKVEEDFERLRQGKEAPTLLLERVLGSCFLASDLRERGLNETPGAERGERNTDSLHFAALHSE
jgi:asparagine synthase (glutamine-hydrolysing)